MKTNRREFLKYGLGGIFGMFLTWAGAVKAEGKQQDDREFCDAGCANCPYWDSCDNAPQDYGPQANTEETEGPKFGEVDCNSYSGCSDCPAQPRCETELGPASDNVSWEDVPPERDPCDTCACRVECDADSVYWCSVEGIETRAGNPWAAGGAPMTDSPAYTYCGAVATGVKDPWQIFWDDTLGSDENGTGTYEDPVATYACARSIADKTKRPHRITVNDLPAIAITPDLRLSGDGYGVIATDAGIMFITYDEEIWYSLTEESATHGNATPYVSCIASADRNAGIVVFELVASGHQAMTDLG